MVNTAIVLACAEGIVKNYDSNLLAANGGQLAFTSNWGKSLLRRMGFVKRRVSTTTKITVTTFEEVRAQFLLDIKVNIEMDESPPTLVINLDQKGILILCLLDPGQRKSKGLKELRSLQLTTKGRLQPFLLGP